MAGLFRNVYDLLYNMDWVENLPPQCPPSNAVPPEGVYYRAVSEKCTENDFIPYARLYPNRKYIGVKACISMALSIHTSVEECAEATKLPALQKQGQTHVAKIILTEKDGLVWKGNDKGTHYSWWRTHDFTIENAVESITAPAL